jgi:hypothetical protein
MRKGFSSGSPFLRSYPPIAGYGWLKENVHSFKAGFHILILLNNYFHLLNSAEVYFIPF